MKYLITGAAGFIGSSISNSLAIDGNSVVGIDNFSDYYSKDLKNERVEKLLSPTGVKFIENDISEFMSINQIFQKEKPDFVIHLAAQAGVRIPLSQSQKYVKSNLVGFANVLQITVENEIPNFIYASSSSVYGDIAKIPYSELDYNLKPNSFYGATKLSNELLTPTLVHRSKTRARGLRLFTVYGPWGRPDMAYFRLFSAALSGSQFNLFGDGSVERDFTYIDDVVSIIKQLCEELQTNTDGFHDIVNIGGGRPLSMNYLKEEIEKVAVKQINIQRKIKHDGDSIKTKADSTYLESIIGKQQFTKLEKGIALFHAWCILPENLNRLEEWVRSSK